MLHGYACHHCVHLSDFAGKNTVSVSDPCLIDFVIFEEISQWELKYDTFMDIFLDLKDENGNNLLFQDAFLTVTSPNLELRDCPALRF